MCEVAGTPRVGSAFWGFALGLLGFENLTQAIQQFRSKMLELKNIGILARSAVVTTAPRTKSRKRKRHWFSISLTPVSVGSYDLYDFPAAYFPDQAVTNQQGYSNTSLDSVWRSQLSSAKMSCPYIKV